MRAGESAQPVTRYHSRGFSRWPLPRVAVDAARMMAIVRASREAIITIDSREIILMFNPMAEHLFGISEREAIGTSIQRFIPERFRAAHSRHVSHFGNAGVSDRQMGRQRVLFGLQANGHEFPIEASISQIDDKSGKLYTIMLRDVTERVQADQTLHASREELRALSANLQEAREDEKRRIARELHDDLGQQLTALKMDMSVIEESLGALAMPDTALAQAIVGQLRRMRRQIDATVASVRRIAADLRPIMLDDLGLVAAIEWLANDFTNRYGIEVDMRIEHGETSFSRDGATALFRIVQEALTNVARHAEASLVTLCICREDEDYLLSIADNGRGPAQSPPTDGKSFGLLGIRERAHMLGGAVMTHTGSAGGFVVSVRFPANALMLDKHTL